MSRDRLGDEIQRKVAAKADGFICRRGLLAAIPGLAYLGMATQSTAQPHIVSKTRPSFPLPPVVDWNHPAKFRRFVSTLRQKLLMADIDPALINRSIILNRDYDQTMPLVDDQRPLLTRLIERPSLAQQLKWHVALQRISREIKDEFNSNGKQYDQYSMDETDVDLLIYDATIQILSMMDGVTAGEPIFDYEKLARHLGPAPRRIDKPLRWMKPVRIGAVTSPARNAQIKLALERVKAISPNAPIDKDSFGAPEDQQNIHIIDTEASFAHNDNAPPAEPLGEFYATLQRPKRAKYARPVPDARIQTIFMGLAQRPRDFHALFSPSRSSAAGTILTREGEREIDNAYNFRHSFNAIWGGPANEQQLEIDILILGSLGAIIDLEVGRYPLETQRDMMRQIDLIYPSPA